MHRNGTSRRDFLKAGAALALFAATQAKPRAAFAAGQTGDAPCVSRTRPLMGTFVTVTVAHSSQAFAEDAVERAFERMRALIPLFDRFDATSPLSVLNAQGALHSAPRELTGLLETSRAFHSLTEGAFDPTVKPVLDLFAATAARDPQVRISQNDIRELLPLVDLTALRIGPSTLTLEKRGMGLTLDGLAKGRIVDLASETLLALGATNHLVDAGGDIRTSGERALGRPWAVAVQNPEGGDYPAVLRMRNGAVATSGAYEVWFGDNRLCNHIVDPRSGHSPALLSSATVRARCVADADALSTALFVAPPRQGLALIDSLPGTEALLLTQRGGSLASRGWDNPLS
ncbi:MAG: FAD:protein FMN transferase [Desulfovibrio sp.]